MRKTFCRMFFTNFAGNPEPIEQTTAWLYKWPRNKITDSYRKQKLPLADDVLQTSESDEDSFDWKEMMFSNDSTPETEYLRNLFWEELKAALDELPAAQRDVFIQNEIDGIAFKDMASASGGKCGHTNQPEKICCIAFKKQAECIKR
ncbi:MAG: hypothetical protein WDM90_17365 [Ferruginibacter sp.]